MAAKKTVSRAKPGRITSGRNRLTLSSGMPVTPPPRPSFTISHESARAGTPNAFTVCVWSPKDRSRPEFQGPAKSTESDGRSGHPGSTQIHSPVTLCPRGTGAKAAIPQAVPPVTSAPTNTHAARRTADFTRARRRGWSIGQSLPIPRAPLRRREVQKDRLGAAEHTRGVSSCGGVGFSDRGRAGRVRGASCLSQWAGGGTPRRGCGSCWCASRACAPGNLRAPLRGEERALHRGSREGCGTPRRGRGSCWCALPGLAPRAIFERRSAAKSGALCCGPVQVRAVGVDGCPFRAHAGGRSLPGASPPARDFGPFGAWSCAGNARKWSA
jgi:hypothetical protein